MAHEELKKQYEEDQKKYGAQAFEFWEYKYSCDKHFSPLNNTPAWEDIVEYRRKEPPFQPEYFSGLNWHDTMKLEGKVVEFSNTGGIADWTTPRKLIEVCSGSVSKFMDEYENCYIYIRTCPETHQNKRPTITIAGGWKLPRPETDTLEKGTEYFFVDKDNYVHSHTWRGDALDRIYIETRRIHLTEDRAQEWADWWDEAVIKAVNG